DFAIAGVMPSERFSAMSRWAKTENENENEKHPHHYRRGHADRDYHQPECRRTIAFTARSGQ
ncbi:MAG: hypothetical protein KJ070_14465, partial [Verrucomicrobia bacterium]|nr:hypothetical protein [Verrucomicrobiota bacterium]